MREVTLLRQLSQMPGGFHMTKLKETKTFKSENEFVVFLVLEYVPLSLH